MNLRDQMEYLGKSYRVEYHDSDSFDGLPADLCTQVYGVCFLGDKLLIGLGGRKQGWGLIGGTVETGESFEQTLEREIKEESNMRVVKSLPIGYQIVYEDDGRNYQLRYACMVEPLGEFESDPGGTIMAIKLIDPADYKQYFDWGKIGDRIINRAVELKAKL